MFGPFLIFRQSSEMQRMVIFNFPASSEGARTCPLGMLSRYAYFKSLFTGWQEGTTGEVAISDTDPKAFDCMLQYLFTGDLSCKLDLGLLVHVLVLANKYLMADLLALVSLRIVDIITDGKKMKHQGILPLAELLGFSEVAQRSCPTLQKKIICAILRHRIQVVEDPSFLEVVVAGSAVALAKLLRQVKKKTPCRMFQKRRKFDEGLFSLDSEQPVPAWGNTNADTV